MIHNETLQWYLPLFLLLYLLVVFVVPSYRVYKQTGINPVTFGKSDNAHDYIGLLMKLATGLLVAVVLLFSFWQQGYLYTAPFGYLDKNWVQVTGLVLMHVSLLWIIVAQQQMRNSWRIGIDEKNRTELVTRGIFSLSRNPVFLGMLVSLLGVFLVIPNSITLALLLVNYCLIQIQIRLEESFLIQQHGEAYRRYQNRVRRLV